MSTFNINTGHTLTGGDIGARGICGLKEEVLTRQLGAEIDKELRNRGHKTHMCRVDHANTLSESLNKQVNLCNSINADLNIVVHFNKCTGGYGSEVYTYQGKYLVEADRVLKELNKLGFKNRGIKNQSLALTRRTNAKTIYIEVCFIDSQHDVNILNKYGMNGIAKAIVNGVLGTSTSVSRSSSPSSSTPLWEQCINGDIVKRLQHELNIQFAAGLKEDGWFGNDTLNKCITVHRNAHGNISKIIQERLIAKGAKGIVANGHFQDGTYAQLRLFQKNHGLSVDGVCGKNTWKELFKK